MKTFAGFKEEKNLSGISADIALLGIPYGSPYDASKPPHSLRAPEVIREESNRYADDPAAWDFDLGGTLLGETGARVVDCGNLPGSQDDPAGNQARTFSVIKAMLDQHIVPVVLGGDDSVPIPVMKAYEGRERFTVLQLDAHLDWRDSIHGVRYGYSSTMRRASEMTCTAGILQAGMRGVGSARTEEYQAANAYGVRIVPAKTINQQGAQAVLAHLPDEKPCFLTIDFDVLDPAVMPAVGAPTPGGLDYQTLLDIIQGAAQKTRIAGVCLVELVPDADVHNLGAITAMRVAWHVLGVLARNKK